MKLLDSVVMNTSIVSEFKSREEESKKNTTQQNIDANFAKAISNVRLTVIHVCDAREHSDFVVSNDVSNRIKEMLAFCKASAEQGLVVASDTAKINGMNRDLNEVLASEWKVYYVHKTSSIKELLSVVKSISSSEVNDIIKDIDSATGWDADAKTITRMIQAIDKANNLIEKLDLNESILAFLKKMLDRKACLEDLTDDVLSWIEKENLKSRVKLSFGI